MAELIEQTAVELWFGQDRHSSFEAMVDGVPVPFLVEGRVERGSGPCLLTPDSDPLTRAPWHDAGYGVAPFLDTADHDVLVSGIETRVASWLREAGVRDLRGFTLESYHRFAQRAPEAHEAVQERITMPLAELPIDAGLVAARIREACGAPDDPRLASSPQDYALVRIVRPSSNDHLAPHRDFYTTIEGRKFVVNAFIPIAGCDQRTSLPVIPGSHFWAESELRKTAPGARCNGHVLPVPVITGAARGLNFIRPNPGTNQILVFSPHLIHGAGANLRADMTRVSLEIRLATRPDPWDVLRTS